MSKDKVKKTKKADKTKGKNKKELTPLEKARLARKNGTSKPRTKKTTFKPKSKDLKSAWYLVQVKTEKDGMLAGRIKASRYVGAIEENKDEKKVANLASYDIATLVGIQARLAGATFHPTGRPRKDGTPTRLEKNTQYTLHVRMTISKEGLLSAGVKKVFVETTTKKGRVKLKELDKTDPQAKKLRRVNKYFGAAFIHATMPPKVTRRKSSSDDDE